VRLRRCAKRDWHDESERSEIAVLPVHLPQMRPPSFWPGSIGHLPPIRGGSAKKDGVFGIENRPDSTFNMRPVVILVNGTRGFVGRKNTLAVFKRFLSKKTVPLSGAPPIRRLKTYSAQSGYVYQYFYEGHRPYRSSGDQGTEFVFHLSSDRKTWFDTAVYVSDASIAAWQQTHGRELSSTERYAVAKIALFQAFDERPEPAQLSGEIRVRAADVEGIVETLGL